MGGTPVVTQPLYRELRKHREGGRTRKIKERAARALDKINQWLEATDVSCAVRKNVSIVFRDNPLIDFVACHLDKDIEDDNFLASIVELHGEEPDARIVFVTEETNLRMGARRRSIEVYALPKESRLRDESDPEHEELVRLRRQNNELQSAMPRLHLSFASGRDFETFPLHAPLANQEVRIEYGIQKEREKHKPFLILPPNDPRNSILGMPHDGISKGEKIQYNRNLEDYFDAFRLFLIRYLDYENSARRTITLRMLLNNDGTAPGDNVTLFLDFP